MGPFFVSKKLLYVSVCLIGVTSAILITTLCDLPNEKQNLEVYFFNVDQGDSILIVAPNGNSILVDGGQANNMARDALGKIKTVFDNSIDVVLGTHGDADHIGGLTQVLDTYTTSLFVETGYESDTDMYKILKSRINDKKIKKLLLYKNSKIVLDKKHGVTISVLHPSFEFVEGLYMSCIKKKKRNKNCDSSYVVDTNDMSLVLMLEYRGKKILLTGDASKEVEDFILQENNLSADVLKLGHHGSKSSSGESFLKEVKPLYSIVSAGLKNRYGHPHHAVIETVKKVTHSKILETKNVQAYILFQVSDSGIQVVEK